MGRILQLTGVTLTDTTAPRIPHSAGVAGAAHRYIADHIAADTGSNVKGWADVAGAGNLTQRLGSGAGPVLTADATVGRYLNFSTTVAMSTAMTLSGLQPAVPVTIAVVMRPAVGTQLIEYNGYKIRRHGTGVLGTNEIISTFNGDGKWVVAIATLDGANSRFTAGGNTWTAPSTATAPTPSGVFYVGDYSLNPAADIAEVIVWNRSLTAAEHTTVRNSLRTKYPAAA